MLEQAWAGVDVGKEHHHCVVIESPWLEERLLI
jgi:hypothetical protein